MESVDPSWASATCEGNVVSALMHASVPTYALHAYHNNQTRDNEPPPENPNAPCVEDLHRSGDFEKPLPAVSKYKMRKHTNAIPSPDSGERPTRLDEMRRPPPSRAKYMPAHCRGYNGQEDV